jgi:squalene-associated FAD-dependent desaturase
MNTPIEQASMRILAAVLRDSLGAARAASDLLLPRVDLSSLFPDPACDWLRAQGATIRTGCRVNAVASADGGAVRVDGERFDAAIVACAPYHAAPLLADEHLSAAVKTMTFWPIYTVYLGFDRAPRLPEVMLGLRDGTAHWLFDREVLCGEAGMVAAVISAPAPDERRAGLDLVAAVLADVQRVAPHLPAPLWSRVVVDKRATFAARAGFTRPGMRLDIPSVYLAGDWIESAYPATLEGAVRSGVAAAHALMRDLRKKQ